MKRRVLLALAIIVALAALAAARPGGGESFSGGGGHGGGDSGGGGGGGGILELAYWLLRLVISYPQVGVPIVCAIVIYFVYSGYRRRQNADWDSGPPVEFERAIQVGALRGLDPDFSQIVFEDFVFRLFSTAQRARHSAATLATVAPYVSAAARKSLAERAPVGEPVVSVVIGALRTYRMDTPSEAEGAARVRLGIEIEADVTTAKHTYYSVETWLLGRAAAVRSKPPARAKTFPCPNCGAPWQAKDTGTQVCASCGQIVDNGRFDWLVEQISVASIDERPPTLTVEVPERGTDLETYRQPGVDESWLALQDASPGLTFPALQARLAMIYDQLNAAWSSGDLEPVRGLVSDGLYDYLQYWVAAYKSQGLKNQLDHMQITHTTIARLTRDRYFDAITIRVWGKGKDYVVRTQTGALVRGSKHRDRSYSEYWTLIRAAGAPAAAPKDSPACGNCGAPLHITMAGTCEHCGAHLTAGEFDWVLSKIEQDDSYRG